MLVSWNAIPMEKATSDESTIKKQTASISLSSLPKTQKDVSIPLVLKSPSFILSDTKFLIVRQENARNIPVRDDVNSFPHCLNLFKTVLPIAGHTLTDNLHSRRTDTLATVHVDQLGPFRMQLSQLPLLVHLYPRVYLREGARTCVHVHMYMCMRVLRYVATLTKWVSRTGVSRVKLSKKKKSSE